jgi:hypothetical protein
MAEKKITSTQVPASAAPKTTTTTNTSHVRVSTTPATKSTSGTIFTKENYKWMIIGLVIIAIGMFLMAGGKSTDPHVFEQKEVYSPRRITIAPLLIAIGLGMQVFAIFKKPKNSTNQ